MSKIAVVYWSSTGNTEEMAKAVAQGARGAGAPCDLLTCGQMDAAKAKQYDALMFGCPAMGDEVLEEGAFEPFFAEAESHLQGVPVALFGSYGWGGGAWTTGAGAAAASAPMSTSCAKVMVAEAASMPATAREDRRVFFMGGGVG